MSVSLNVTTRDFIDFDFVFARHPLSDNLALKKNISAVRQSILNLLRLKRGDKPHHPEIFSPVGDFLFENASSAMKIVLESEIMKYLAQYEPRIEISEVTVNFPDVNSLDIDVVGTLVNTTFPVTINILIERTR